MEEKNEKLGILGTKSCIYLRDFADQSIQLCK